MDFIERWFGIAPDGGNGVLETWLIIGAVGVVLVLFRNRLLRLSRRVIHGLKGAVHWERSLESRNNTD